MYLYTTKSWPRPLATRLTEQIEKRNRMRAEIEYLGLTVEPLELSYEFYRDTHKNGKPATMVPNRGVKAKIEADHQSIRFLEEILTVDGRLKNRALANTHR